MDQIEIPQFDDDPPVAGYNFGGFGTSDESSFGGGFGSGFAAFNASDAGPSPFGGSSTSSSRPRGDSNPAFPSISPPTLLNSSNRKGSFANVSSQLQQHVRNKSASGHKSGSSTDRSYNGGGGGANTSSPVNGMSKYSRGAPSLSQSQSSRRDSLPPLPANTEPSASLHAPLEMAAYLVLDSFFEKAEEKMLDALNRPIVRSLHSDHPN